MKIGLVCPYNLFKGGGVQECVLAMQAELSARGYQALIITPEPREHPAKVPEFVRLLGRSADLKSFHTTAQVSVSVDTQAVDELLEAERFDVLHFHEPWVPLLSRQILSRSQSKNIATFHAKLPDTVMSRTIEKVVTPYTKSVLKYFHSFTAVSEPAADYVRSLTFKPVSIVPNGIDLDKYRTLKTPREPSRMIFYIGRLEKRKGLKYLLKAVQALQTADPTTELCIAGDGPDREQLERYAEELGVKVKFLGRVDEATKLRFFHTAGVFCSPARYGESFGIVLLEAMACGLPVVAGNNPGYGTVLTGTGRISLVDPKDTDEFARRLDLMLGDEPLRGVWKNWAARAVQPYDYPEIVDQYEHIFKS